MSFDASNTPFESIGGEAPVRALVDAFYDTMDREPGYTHLRDLHEPDLTEARDKLFWFLCGWLGGPNHFVERFGHPRLRARHAHVRIGTQGRDEWLACMADAMNACGIEGPLRQFLDARFAHVADFMRNVEA